MLEAFRTDDNLVGKYIHDDDSETAIKCVSSCDTVLDPATGALHHNDVDRRKYSIFVSSSAGCFMRCNFCYLTLKNARYGKITSEKILANLKEAVRVEEADNPGIRERWAKVNWMGMGEDHTLRPARLVQVTPALLDWLLEKGLTRGLDGVDVSSVLPAATAADLAPLLHTLNDRLADYPLNPNNSRIVHASNAYSGDVERSRLRMFYSLHSGVQSTRDRMIPNAMALRDALPRLREISDGNRINLIFHHMFMTGQNDSEAEVDAFLELVTRENLKAFEFRILRYNSCRNTPFDESERFNGIIERVMREIPRLKVQISTGREVSAACGQFIVRNFRPPKPQVADAV